MKRFPKLLAIIVVLSGIFFSYTARARVYLDITSADLRKLPVAIPPFIDPRHPDVITAKGSKMALLAGKALALHGFIKIIPTKSSSNDRSADWKAMGADFVMLGNYNTGGKTGMTLEIRFIDTSDGRMIIGKRYRAPWSKQGNMIRKFCDEVIYQLTGTMGISNTKIAYVSDQTGSKEVYLTDILGENSRQVTNHHSITVSPRFSPDGSELAYTSYHRGNPDLYLTKLSQSRITRAISWRHGLNIAPAWSANGKTMVVTLSRGGNSDLYLMTINGRIIRRLTKNNGINISPSWAPDDHRLAFVSDRGGNPQIYIMDMRSRTTTRLTYAGDENTTPNWSPNGKMIAYTGRVGSTHQIFVIAPDGGSPTQLTRYWGDYESPSWAPDSRQIIFSRSRNGKRQLCRMFIKGRAVIPIPNLKGNQAFPQWSPRLKY
ncbi:MAG: protein TolB [Deltaproteobacteria bacterium]|nr:protein TolB [Deltaproteobacteria bacterium]